MDGDDGCVMWVYLMSLNCTVKNGKFYAYFTTIKKYTSNRKNYEVGGKKPQKLKLMMLL